MKLFVNVKRIFIAAAVIALCAPLFAAEKAGSVKITVPKGAEVKVRIKTADGSPVKVRGADKVRISGADEARELNEDKPMQTLTATGTEITFTGALREFDVKDNGFVEGVDLSCCPNLEVLYCAGNKLTSLDLSANKSLKRLQCYNNQLTALDVSALGRLELLWCGINKLTALDVSGCKNLTQLRCYRNMIESGATDALLKSLPEREGEIPSVREARILAGGDNGTNGKPSAAALDEAQRKGWTILDSADAPVTP
ncbi:MAG: leucine-rich repeat domain-containing protein [Treponema sp.]